MKTLMMLTLLAAAMVGTSPVFAVKNPPGTSFQYVYQLKPFNWGYIPTSK